MLNRISFAKQNKNKTVISLLGLDENCHFQILHKKDSQWYNVNRKGGKCARFKLSRFPRVRVRQNRTKLTGNISAGQTLRDTK